MALTEGWLIFDSGGAEEMKIHGKWKFKQRNPDVWIEHYPGGQNGFDIGTRQRIIVLNDLWFPTKADAEMFLEYIDLLNTPDPFVAGGWKLELQVHSDESKFKLNGGVASFMMVLCIDFGDLEKVPYGDDQLYRIKNLKVEQAT